eukprot:14398760-Alexandrium_andersonii.AAC.1
MRGPTAPTVTASTNRRKKFDIGTEKAVETGRSIPSGMKDLADKFAGKVETDMKELVGGAIGSRGRPACPQDGLPDAVTSDPESLEG